jgi:hypothetical protein
MPVLFGGYVHPSARKALQLLGHGRDSAQVFTPGRGRPVNLATLRLRLRELADVADLAEEFGACCTWTPTASPPTRTSGSTCRTRTGSYSYANPPGSVRSRRAARALPIWATLPAHGRSGYRALVERHCTLAWHLAATVDAAPDPQRLTGYR